MPTLAISDSIGRRPDPDASPRVEADGIAIAVEAPTWIDGQLLIPVWLTLALRQDRFAEFLDPIEAVVICVDVPEFGLFGAWALVDRTEIPIEPSVANYQGPTGWGNPAVTMRAHANFVLDLQLGDPGGGNLPEHVPEDFSVFLRASLHELVSNAIEVIPGKGEDDAAGVD
jgi:hypothetical protein